MRACARGLHVGRATQAQAGYWLCLSSELCFPVGKGEGGDRGKDPSENLSAAEEGEDLENRLRRIGLGRALSWFHMDWGCLLLVLPRVGEVGEVGARWKACRGPSRDCWLQHLSPFLLCLSFFICEVGEDPYLGTRMLMGFDGSMIGAAQMKAASVSLEEWGFLSSGKSMVCR